MNPDLYLIGFSFIILILLMVLGHGKTGIISVSVLGIVALFIYIGLTPEALFCIALVLIILYAVAK